jgi:hypothetical protein
MGFSLFDRKIDDPENISVFMIESTIFGISGLLLGAYIDVQFKKLTQKYPEKRNLIAFAQLLLLVVIIATMFKLARDVFALHFQKTLPGMAFPAMYFGVQSNLFETSEKLFS